jgi:hypothetical protein
MAFSSNGTTSQLGRFTLRIMGLQLAAGTSGVIGLAGDATCDLQLPAGWPPAETLPAGVTLNDVIRFQYVQIAFGAAADHIHVNKTTAPVTNTFRIMISNDTGNPVNMEAYIQYFHSLIR